MSEQCIWCLQAELEDLCFAVLHPQEYTALRSELDSIWGLQQVTDLVPFQADTLMSQAMASIKTATDIATASSAAPEPHLPAPGPVPRPTLSPPSDQQSHDTKGVSSVHTTSNQTEAQQSVQSVAGDLYAHSEHGMVRAAAQARINSRQQKALQSGLLRLSAPAQQKKSEGQRSAAAVLDPPKTAAPPSASATDYPSASSQSRSPVSSTQPQPMLRSQDDHIGATSANCSSTTSSSLDNPDEGGPQLSRAVTGSPRAVSSSAQGNTGNAGADVHSPGPAANGLARVIRGRAPRQALAAQQAAKSERQKSGSTAGPSGRTAPDYSFLTPDQQKVPQQYHQLVYTAV